MEAIKFASECLLLNNLGLYGETLQYSNVREKIAGCVLQLSRLTTCLFYGQYFDKLFDMKL